jgi:hypothetical protein
MARRRETGGLIARVALGAAGALAGLFLLRTIPDLVRYLRIRRM